MKKFNLAKEIIIVEKSLLHKTIESKEAFAITFDGKITNDFENEIIIFKTDNQTPKTIEELFENNYKIAQSQTQVAIKASLAWREIVELNYLLATYDDSSNEGISEFDDENLEKIGWWADEFDINYRELVEVLENKAKGVVLCIEQESPYHFSGLGFIEDTQEAYAVLYSYCREKIKEKIKSPEYADLSKEEQKALEFFGLLSNGA